MLTNHSELGDVSSEFSKFPYFAFFAAPNIFLMGKSTHFVWKKVHWPRHHHTFIALKIARKEVVKKCQ